MAALPEARLQARQAPADENGVNLAQIANVFGGVRVEDDKVGAFSRGNGAAVVGDAQSSGRVCRECPDDFERRESRLLHQPRLAVLEIAFEPPCRARTRTQADAHSGRGERPEVALCLFEGEDPA